jgi:hypothetical protein
MPRRSQIVDCGKSLRIYVGGLSQANEDVDLKTFFSQYGQVSTIEFITKFSGPNGAKKSYYILTTRSEDAFKRIIDSQDIVYKNRKLICMKYMTGPELLKHNQDQNRRRFLIKYVPKEVSETNLRHMLNSQVGEVEILYRLENKLSPQEYGGQGNDHKYRTFGLLLKDRTVASHLPDLFSITNRSTGWKITIHRFYYHKKEPASRNRLEERFHPCHQSKTVQNPFEKTHHVHTSYDIICAENKDPKESPATSFFGENKIIFSNPTDLRPSNHPRYLLETRLTHQCSTFRKFNDLDQWHQEDNIRINVAQCLAADPLQGCQKKKNAASAVERAVCEH